MAINGSQLGQLRPANTTAASLYSPASGETQVTALHISNTSAAAATFRVFHDDDGTTYDETTALYWDVTVAAGDAVTITWDKGLYMNDATGNLAVRTSVADALTFTLYGLEKT